MTITQTMSAIADAAAQRYGLLIDGWRALYGRALDDPQFGSPAQIYRFQADAYAMASRFRETEWPEIADALHDIAGSALETTSQELSVSSVDVPDEISEHVDEFIAHLQFELSLQLERDMQTLVGALRKTILAVQLAARVQRLPLRTALIQHRVAVNTDVNFSFRDRRGVKWPTARYIRTIWRHDLLALYNDVVLMMLADHGVDTAHIQHEDPAAELHGLEVSLVANTDLPTYAEIRDEAFHPNANAVMARLA